MTSQTTQQLTLAACAIEVPLAADARAQSPSGGAPPARPWGQQVPPAMLEAFQKRIEARAEQGPHARFDPKMSALVLVEFQRDWLDPRGTLRQVVREPDAMDAAAKRAEAALAAARKTGMHVVHVSMRLSPSYAELGTSYYGVRGIQPMVQPFRTGTPGVEFMPSFEPITGEFEPSGRTGISAFAGSNLDTYLRNNGITTLYVAGFATEVCFEGTLRDGHDRGYHMIALTDAAASFTRAAHEASLKTSVHHFAYKMDTDRFVRTTGSN